MHRARFELALERLRPAHWERFEQLASEFLVDEYPNLRTTAAPSGDKGRDARLWQPGHDDAVVLQFSVQQDWRGKIRDTAGTVQKNFGDARILIYVTNQVIGAAADDLPPKIRRDFGLYLDICDQSWFLERVNSTPGREAAAELLAQEVVDPYLASREVIAAKAPALSSDEARAACVYLGLQWADDTREKGLTKLSFEALVRSVLRDTDPEHLMSRVAVQEAVRSLVPTHDPATVDGYTDTALTRLAKRYIRHYRKDDKFCLTFEERTRIRDRLAEIDQHDRRLRTALRVAVTEACATLTPPLSQDVDELVTPTRLCIDRLLWRKGEEFADAVLRDTADFAPAAGLGDLAETVARETWGNDLATAKRLSPVLAASADTALTNASEEIQAYLRQAAHAYTLFAFLRETPDVQSAMVKMFSHGEVWFDTSIVLPLFAEELIPEEYRRLYTNMVLAARESGLTLRMTAGVAEEIDSHMTRCLAYARVGSEWEGKVPFLAAAFIRSGQARVTLPRWLDRFRGTARPLDDISEYVAQEFGIETGDLQADAATAPLALRGAVQEVWYEAHERRRQDAELDANTTARLVDHDVENYLGVVRRRRRERDSAFGYTSWWLTLDRTAYLVRSRIAQSLPAADVPPSPVMSPDFMATYLAIGPMRARVAKRTEEQLPLALSDISVLDLMPKELADEAEVLREEMKGMPEHVIRRRVRDRLDEARRKGGPITQGGLEAAVESLAPKA
jgi:hypothetical protein